MPVVEELRAELYGGDDPFSCADPIRVDTAYPHTNLSPRLIRAVLEFVQPTFWLEIGSMVGGSAIRAAGVIKENESPAQIVCIDPFTGGMLMWAWEQPRAKSGGYRFLQLQHGRPTIYDRFLANVAAAGHADIILPIAASSIVGVKLLQHLIREKRLSVVPTVIYLDSAHEPDETFLELRTCWDLLPKGGVLMGDDWVWDSVRSDVLRFVRTVELDKERRDSFASRWGYDVQQDGVVLFQGQWVLVK